MTRRQRVLAAVSVVLAACVMTGCVTPATGRDSYVGKASNSVDAATSEVETARINVRLLIDSRIIATYAKRSLSESETALGAITAAFGSVTPPVDADQLRTRVNRLLTRSEDAVASARIAAQRSDLAGLQRAAVRLQNVSDALSQAGETLS